MSQAEELLNSMVDGAEGHIVIGNDRFIKVPASLKRIAVQHDHNVETVTFDCPRYWDGLDMSKMAIYVNYMLVNGYKDSYPVGNVVVDDTDDNIMHFDWVISRNVTQVKGAVTFLICIKKTGTDEDGNEEVHWNSELNKEMYVSEGLECEEIPEELVPDIVTELLLKVRTAEEKVGGLEETVEGIEEKISTFENKVDDGLNTVSALTISVTALDKKVDEADKKTNELITNLENAITQESGDSETAVMSQKAVTDEVTNLHLLHMTGACDVTNFDFVNKAVGSDTGEPTAVASNRLTTENTIPIPEGAAIYAELQSGYVCTLYLFDISGGLIAKTSFSASATSYTPPENVHAFRPVAQKLNGSDITPEDFAANVRLQFINTDNPKELNDRISGRVKKVLINEFDKNNVTPGYLGNKGGTISNSSTYVTSDFIPVAAGESITISPKCRKILHCDEFKQGISLDDVVGWGVTTITAAQDGYIRVSVYATDVEKVMIEHSDTRGEYVEHGPLKIEEGVEFSKQQKSYITDAVEAGPAYNVLYGKKWAVCGDSFTAGDFSNAPEGDDHTIAEGPYAGKNKVYGYIIGTRNNMTIQDLAACGKTLAYPADGSFHNSFTDVLGNEAKSYMAVAEDVDYVTIYLGINDSHHESGSSGTDGEDVTGDIPLGTIDDADNTTFCGAWNVCLGWLITNRPFAHIGIIVSNGCERDEFRTATIAIANKWGIPYIDLNGDERTPMMIRSTNPAHSSAARNARTRAQAVAYGANSHPSAKAHEYQSTFIEAWLGTL